MMEVEGGVAQVGCCVCSYVDVDDVLRDFKVAGKISERLYGGNK